jgi:tRNA threonylcarbamoyl adenosine modification protein (Sua5/YciO/YrdC/YwlC family)
MTATIGIVLGSFSDVARIEPGIKRLQAMQVPFEICIASAHRTPERLAEWLGGAEARGVRVIVAGAGAAAHLPGVVASQTLLPVIGLPFNASPIGGTDALYSIVQMPPGIPVATVGIDSAENAMLLAIHILAVGDPAVREKLRAFRAEWAAKIEEQNARLYAAFPQARPVEPPAGQAKRLASAPSPNAAAAKAAAQAWAASHAKDFGPAPDEPPAASPDGGAVPVGAAAPGAGEVSVSAPAEAAPPERHLRVDPDRPELAAIERAIEVLRAGGVIALPTDTVYGLAADATNAAGVARLYALKGRAPDKPIPVLVDSDNLFRMLIVEVPERIDVLMERCWPGPLSLVGRKRPQALPAISQGDSLAVRVPDNMVALSVVNMLDRPLATTSANLSGQPPATTADEVLALFGEGVDLVLDSGPVVSSGVSTVLCVTEKPYRILRDGALPRETLREILGDLLAE